MVLWFWRGNFMYTIIRTDINIFEMFVCLTVIARYRRCYVRQNNASNRRSSDIGDFRLVVRLVGVVHHADSLTSTRVHGQRCVT
jgi:hypothetical protein